MISIPRSNRFASIDARIWLALIFAAVAFIQQIAGYVTDMAEVRTGQRAALLLVAFLAFSEMHRDSNIARYARILFYGAAVVLVYKSVAYLPGMFAAAPREWDFLVFFLDANVAAAGLNLYDPAGFIQVAAELQLQISDEFRREIIGAGFMYPPWTALLFYPLSFGDIGQSNRLWLIFVSCAYFLAWILMSQLLTRSESKGSQRFAAFESYVFAAVMFSSIPFSVLGLRHGQTTSLFTCLAILTLVSGGRAASGVFACLTVVVKPFAAIPAALLLIGRYWTAVLAGLVAAGVVFAVSVAVLGMDDWRSYLKLEFATETPTEPYSHPGNLSLLSVLVRWFGYTGIPWANLPIMIWYGSISAMVAIPSFWLSTKISKVDFRTAYCALLVMALIVYPGTIYTYSIIVCLPMAIEMWNQLKANEHFVISMVFLGGASLLVELNLFAANVFIWLFLLRRCLVLLRTEPSTPNSKNTLAPVR